MQVLLLSLEKDEREVGHSPDNLWHSGNFWGLGGILLASWPMSCKDSFPRTKWSPCSTCSQSQPFSRLPAYQNPRLPRKDSSFLSLCPSDSNFVLLIANLCEYESWLCTWEGLLFRKPTGLYYFYTGGCVCARTRACVYVYSGKKAQTQSQLLFSQMQSHLE